MPPLRIAEIAVLAYLLGSIPFGYLLVRFFRKEDIRSKGSGNIGATNVLRSGSKKLGALTFFLDVLKGALAVMVGIWMSRPYSYSDAIPGVYHWSVDAAALAGLLAVLGHIYPIWLGFKGGKGVATAFGVFLALAIKPAFLALMIFILVMAIFRIVSLASLVATALFPFLVLTLNSDSNTIFFTAVVFFLAFLIIVKHRQNIVRLLHGTEYKFGSRKRETGA